MLFFFYHVRKLKLLLIVAVYKSSIMLQSKLLIIFCKKTFAIRGIIFENDHI